MSVFGKEQRLSLITLAISISLSACGLVGSDRVNNWHALRASGQAALSKNDYAAAKASFQSAYQEVVNTPDEDLRAVISIKDLSSICLNSLDYSQVTKVANKALNYAEQFGRREPNSSSYFEQFELGQALNNFGDYYYIKAKDFDRAARFYDSAANLFARLIIKGDENSPSCFPGYYLARSICGLGQSYRAQQRITEASNIYRRSTEEKILAAIPEVARMRLLANYADLPISGQEKREFAEQLGIAVGPQPER